MAIDKNIIHYERYIDSTPNKKIQTYKDWLYVTGYAALKDEAAREQEKVRRQLKRFDSDSLRVCLLNHKIESLKFLDHCLYCESRDKFRALWNAGYFETNKITPDELAKAAKGEFTRKDMVG